MNPSPQCRATSRVPYRMPEGGTILVRCDLAVGHPGMHAHDEILGFENGIPMSQTSVWPRRLVAAAQAVSDRLARLLERRGR